MTAQQHGVETIIRIQFAVFQALSEAHGLNSADRRRLLHLRADEWWAWCCFLSGAPQPARPTTPDILLRFAETSFTLAAMLERRTMMA
jgi:hypothetical protein